MQTKAKSPYTLFFSPPGGYPAIANLGLEIVVESVKKDTQASCETLRSDLFLCRYIHPELLNKIANLDAMDFFYAHRFFPRFSSERQIVGRDEYLELNGVTASEKNAVRGALPELESYFKRCLEEKKPKVLAVSLNSDRLITALYFINMALQTVPEIRIIIGGSALHGDVGASVFHNFPEIDYLVTGRGECVAGRIIEQINSGEEMASIPGLMFSRNAGSVDDPEAFMCRSAYPLPEMDEFYEELVRLTEQLGRDAFGNMYGIAVIQSSGCRWGKCDFCSEPDQNPGYFLEDCNVVARYVYRLASCYHISDIFFLDSIQPPANHLRRLCRLLNEHSLPYRISGEIHAGIDSETLDLLIESGFKTVQVGIEAYSQDQLDQMRKGTKLLDIIHILVKCFNRSVSVQGNILMHHPLETTGKVKETKRVMALTSHLFVPFLQHYFVAHGSRLSTELRSRKIKTYPLRRHSLLYPRSLRKRLVFSYRYLPENKKTYALWRNLVEGQKKAAAIRKPVLMYIDGKESMQIIDSRHPKRKSYYIDRMGRDLIVACTRPSRLSDIVSRIAKENVSRVSESLDRLVQAGILLKQQDRYLSLITPWKNARRKSI